MSSTHTPTGIDVSSSRNRVFLQARRRLMILALSCVMAREFWQTKSPWMKPIATRAVTVGSNADGNVNATNSLELENEIHRLRKSLEEERDARSREAYKVELQREERDACEQEKKRQTSELTIQVERPKTEKQEAIEALKSQLSDLQAKHKAALAELELKKVPQSALSSLKPSENSTAHDTSNSTTDWECVWDDKDEDLKGCERRLAPQLVSSTTVGQVPTKWFFLGDSAMANMAHQINMSSSWVELKNDRSVRWKNVYYNFSDIERKKNDTVPPNASLGEGPSRLPLNWAGARCTFCKNFLWRHKELPLLEVEYLGMEYSKDRAWQTIHTTTSQETMRLYIQKQRQEQKPQLKQHTICVINTGFHEMIIDNPPVTGQLHAENTMGFAHDMLSEGLCDRIVRISINQVSGSTKFSQTPERVVEFNAAIKARLQDYNVNKDDNTPPILLVDVFPKSIRTKRVDHLHMHKELFYQPLAQFWERLMIMEHGSSKTTI